MSTAPGRKALTHEHILSTAARVIRRAGFQGVGVADIMKEAGLTHGGFYAHFASRDALLAEALAHAGQASAAHLAKSIAQRQARGASPLKALVDSYLSDRHLDGAEHGCAVAALASEMPRQATGVREAAAQRVRALIRVVEATLPPGADRGDAAVIASQMVGALQLARSLGDAAEGRALLAANRRALLTQHDAAPGA
jgi:TetR/AcrR family transcriptional repressor of nem operon